MPLRVTNHEFKLLRDLIEDKCGITLNQDKTYLIENRLSALVEKTGVKSFGDLYLTLKTSSQNEGLMDLMVDAITTNETLWFRDQYPYEILINSLFPVLYKKISERKRSKINIWSAACSTGQEPYSIAIKALEYYRGKGDEASCYEQVNILGTDISHSAISQARRGRYDMAEMQRGLPQDYKNSYFKRVGNKWDVVDSIKRLVTFKEYNLKYLMNGTLGPFDIIFLRHVIIYFSDSFKEALFDKISRMLLPKGYMFLGIGETVQGYSNAFDTNANKRGIFYQLK
ncbi:MAG: protein-glutamate O-methyltransferase CheR [Deltaproteobacteria bacterium]|nr:protein-glutamate O-methyltransferase CheR [Deltaproteobacteria bacterium]MBW1915711.1 protein-glutamate O-methyltransferase CheR [Deltaproteobacteria bacterium]